MTIDQQGHALTNATAEAAAHYDQAVEAFNLYRGDPMAALAQAIEIAPWFAMAQILKGHLLALATEPAATVLARSTLVDVRAMPLNDREASHVAALECIVAGEWTAAGALLDRHSMRYPHDLVALQVGHLVDFFRASARNLRDRMARALPCWSSAIPGHSIVLGMYAFGLEETGNYAQAEDVGRRAVALQPLDCWAHHAVAHVLEMQGRAEDGIGWMSAREPYWAGDANFFKVHNWWHRALYHLELGQTEQVLALYDQQVRQTRSAIAVELVDASALLWRLQLTGHTVGERWTALAAAWDAHADGRTYPFNDWHAVMAYLGAGRDADVQRIILAHRGADRMAGETAGWCRSTGLPLVEGFVAFWRRDYGTAVERLHGARQIANMFGGSHAQRDIIDWTLTEAALRGGLRDMALGLANERLAVKPHSPINRSFLARAQNNNTTARRAA